MSSKPLRSGNRPVTGSRHGFVLGMSVLRTRENGVFGPQAMERLRREGDVLLSLVGKHNNCLSSRADVVWSLTMLEDIETCLIESSELPRREVQVCARILHGMSTIGIALDLDIGEESVKTYRKRAYSQQLPPSVNCSPGTWEFGRARMPTSANAPA
jgi:regulatory LuxR family protein